MFSNLRSRLPKTLGFRLAFWHSLIFTLNAFLLFAATYFFTTTAIHQKDRELIWAHMHEYLTLYSKEGKAALQSRYGYFVRLASADNRTLLVSRPIQWNDFDLSVLEGKPVGKKPAWFQISSRDNDYVMNVLAVRLSNGLVLEVGKRTDKWEDLVETFQIIFAILVVMGIVLGFAGGLIFSSRVLKPVRDLIEAVRTIIRTGRMEARVPVADTQDEINELVVLFNHMLERIDGSIRGMKEALDNAAHDLRTPMTRLRSGAEMALQKPEGEASLREALSDCLEESDRVLTMLSTLMDISEAETGTMKLHLQRENLSPLLDEATDLYREVAEEKNIQVTTDFPGNLEAPVDKNRMRQVLANLMDNAIKYTPTGGSVSLSARFQRQWVIIQVKDSGPGIPEADLPKIWDRLYRGDKSRSERGLGLGLSLVRAIVLAHKGDVSASSAGGQGSIFTVRLPASLS